MFSLVNLFSMSRARDTFSFFLSFLVLPRLLSLFFHFGGLLFVDPCALLSLPPSLLLSEDL